MADVDDDDDDVVVVPPKDVLVDSSTVQALLQVSFQSLVDPTILLSVAPITVAGFGVGVLGPGA